MSKHSCRDCEDRHFACWDRCEKYQEFKNQEKEKVDEADAYLQSKATYYKTKYGWRR
jgi:hypothetical protein